MNHIASISLALLAAYAANVAYEASTFYADLGELALFIAIFFVIEALCLAGLSMWLFRLESMRGQWFHDEETRR